jgi:nitroreductase
MSNAVLQALLARRSSSVSGGLLGEPGPSPEQLSQILTTAARVPDHKKLAPWRFILFEGEARTKFGKLLAEVVAREEREPPSPARIEMEEGRFLRAPLVVAVVSRVTPNPAAPEWEQILSAGAACMNACHAASALGFGCQWITEWYAYSAGVRAGLGLAEGERIAGFLYIGTAKQRQPDRDRPKLEAIVSRWN